MATDRECLAKEKAAYECISEIAEKYGDLLGLIWGRGDGYGGTVFGMLTDELLKQGFIKPKPVYKSSPKGGTRKITPRVRLNIYERDGYSCLKCGAHNDLVLSHIVPESLGGATNVDNLQTLCRSCNSRKRTSKNAE
jgi:hypothetical protein